MLCLSLAALGAAAGVYAIGLAIWEPGALTLPVALHVAIGWSFVAAGFVAWELPAREPDGIADDAYRGRLVRPGPRLVGRRDPDAAE
jgi:hypothetical protein